MKWEEYLNYLEEEATVVSDDWVAGASREDLENYLRTHSVGSKTREKINFALARLKDRKDSIEKVEKKKKENKDTDLKIKDAKGKDAGKSHFLYTNQ